MCISTAKMFGRLSQEIAIPRFPIAVPLSPLSLGHDTLTFGPSLLDVLPWMWVSSALFLQVMSWDVCFYKLLILLYVDF